LRASAGADGADLSGLSSLLELSLLSAAGDALVAVALAGSQFFSVPLGQARTRVALYLLITMAPFAILAPVAGPVLDRVHGRRAALGGTMLIRALLAWTLAGKLHALALYPLALGLLASSRAFGVARSAVLPRVLPRAWPLTRGNSRLSLTTVIGGMAAAPIGFAIAQVIGYRWVPRAATLIFALGTLSAFKLPAHVDRALGEMRPPGLTEVAISGRSRWRALLDNLPVSLRIVCEMRILVGFLTIFLAFQLRRTGGTLTGLGALAAAASIGSLSGIFLGGRLKSRPEALMTIGSVLAAAACVGTAIHYMTLTAITSALLATMAASMGKLALDAIIQRDTPETTRNWTFARSETALQLAWVVGGAIGLIPIAGRLAFSLATIIIGLIFLVQVSGLRRLTQRRSGQTTNLRSKRGRPPPFG
jgi:MFS family permease